jgi:hypothetical protein
MQLLVGGNVVGYIVVSFLGYSFPVEYWCKVDNMQRLAFLVVVIDGKESRPVIVASLLEILFSIWWAVSEEK